MNTFQIYFLIMTNHAYEEKVINAIQKGSLSELKTCCIGKNDVNRPLTFHQDIRIVAKHQGSIFPMIQAPTPLIYAILCEQDEILEYLLDLNLILQ